MTYNFGLSADQQALRDAIRRFCDSECSSDRLRAVIDRPDNFAAEQWRGLGALGVFGLALPEAASGSGLGAFDLVVAMETLGRTVLPAPVIETLLAATLIERLGRDEHKARLLPAIAGGAIVATVAIDEAEHYWNPDTVAASGTRGGDGRYRLAGTKPWVAYGHVADIVLVALRVEGELAVALLERDELAGAVTVQDGLDDRYRLCSLSLDGIEIGTDRLIGRGKAAAKALHDLSDLGAVLASAELLGCMERSLELIVEYAKIRTQFGKPIGSYQALKHRCADLLIDIEAARGSVYFAAGALAGETAERDIAVSSAKAFASDAAVRCTEKALQSFGAIGFTWEHDIHFFLKRAKRLEMTFGNAAHHRELIAQHL